MNLKNSMLFPETEERMKQIQSFFDLLVTKYGFIGGTYIVSLTGFYGENNTNISQAMLRKRSQKRSNFLFSNENMKSLRRDFSAIGLWNDPNLQKYLKSDFAIFRYDVDDEINYRCRKILDKYNVKSRLFYRYHDLDHPEFSVEFLLMSSAKPQELELIIANIKEQLTDDLREFHNIVFSSRLTPLLSPFLGLGLISDKGKQILYLIAKGYSRSEISSKLYLTERGVDYHLSKIKNLFGAKSNAELIAYAYKYKLLA